MWSCRQSFVRIATEVLGDYIEKLSECQCEDRVIKKAKDPTVAGSSCVVLIIESPHLYEFSYRKDVAVESKGAARHLFLGQNRKRLEDLFGKLQHWDIYVVNAIQFQCSCGTSTRFLGKIVKDRVVAQLMHERSVQLSLSGRVRDIIKQTSRAYVVDASGSACGNVLHWLKAEMKDVPYVLWGPKIQHPSSWNLPNVFPMVQKTIECDLNRQALIGG